MGHNGLPLEIMLSAHKKLTLRSPIIKTNALNRFIYLLPPNPLTSNSHKFLVCLVYGVNLCFMR
jgi:hypothetical protein